VFKDDYIARIIRQATEALLYAIGLKKAGQYPDAMQAIDQALEQLLGLDADLIRQLSDEALLNLLTMQDQLDLERLELVAGFFKEEGDIHAAENRPAESRRSYLRALNYYLEVGLDEDVQGPTPELAEKIDELAGKLEVSSLPDDTLWAAFCYYEQAGDFAEAEASLSNLAKRPDTRAEILPELIAFYERLLDVPGEELARSHLTKAQVREKLEKARRG
jgi:tetratricopeptide (TPR) repeat protein